jgi:hypothetical protein
MYNVQNYGSYINIPSSQTYRSYFQYFAADAKPVSAVNLSQGQFICNFYQFKFMFIESTM